MLQGPWPERPPSTQSGALGNRSGHDSGIGTSHERCRGWVEGTRQGTGHVGGSQAAWRSGTRRGAKATAVEIVPRKEEARAFVLRKFHFVVYPQTAIHRGAASAGTFGLPSSGGIGLSAIIFLCWCRVH